MYRAYRLRGRPYGLMYIYTLHAERGHMSIGAREYTDSGMTFSLLESSHLEAIFRSAAQGSADNCRVGVAVESTAKTVNYLIEYPHQDRRGHHTVSVFSGRWFHPRPYYPMLHVPVKLRDCRRNIPMLKLPQIPARHGRLCDQLRSRPLW